VDEREYGPTPADIEWSGEDATRGRQVTFVFRLDGYRDYSVTRVITGDRLDIDAEMEPIERAPRPAVRVRHRPRERAHPREPTRPVKGYKLDPY
jgi:hypothetical protein